LHRWRSLDALTGRRRPEAAVSRYAGGQLDQGVFRYREARSGKCVHARYCAKLQEHC